MPRNTRIVRFFFQFISVEKVTFSVAVPKLQILWRSLLALKRQNLLHLQCLTLNFLGLIFI